MSSNSQLSDRDSTKRFSSRVDNYVRYRPGYPAEIVELLKTDCGLTGTSVIADIGSGTGKLTELFLANGNAVFGIEPNKEMREAGERLLAASTNFTSIAATAEETGLTKGSVDFITAGQAFHWFDRNRCRTEFARIMKPGGWVVLIWNDRQTMTNSFLAEYEQLLKTYATDYSKVDHKQIDDEVVAEFFGYVPRKKAFPNLQEFDYDGLKGRLLSSSYAPEEGQPKFAEMIKDLEKLFSKRQQGGIVRFVYDTVVYYGKLS
ncbi:MAG TPA: methyltransferase domain-containing protein [Verrucomicrobiae bacterium]|nr:methyltransferase domain-containing protein [Verrucomicrobiae bacterium]